MQTIHCKIQECGQCRSDGAFSFTQVAETYMMNNKFKIKGNILMVSSMSESIVNKPQKQAAKSSKAVDVCSGGRTCVVLKSIEVFGNCFPINMGHLS